MFYFNCFLSNAAGESSFADPDPGSGTFLTPGSGIEKIQTRDMGSGMSTPVTPDLIFEWVKNTSILWCGSGTGIRDLVNPGSGIRDVKNRIRDPDKHPGYATLGHWQPFIDVFQSKDNVQEVVSLRHPKITFITHPNSNNKPFNETKDSSVRFCRIFNDQPCSYIM